MTIQTFWRIVPSLVILSLTGVALFLMLWSPSSYRVDIGSPGDARFLRNAYLPEFNRDISFRWTGPGSQLILHHTASSPVILDMRIYTENESSLSGCQQIRMEQFRKSIASFERQDGWRTYRVLLAEGQASGTQMIAQPLDILCDQYLVSDLDDRRLGVPIDWVQTKPLPNNNNDHVFNSYFTLKKVLLILWYMLSMVGLLLLVSRNGVWITTATSMLAIACILLVSYDAPMFAWILRDLSIQTWLVPVTLCIPILVIVVLRWFSTQNTAEQPSNALTDPLVRLEPLLVGAIVLVGSIFRFIHFLFIDINLPFLLGGLYLEFARQIAKNGYILPERIPFYTAGGIPFAYPPFPFYVEAVLVDRLHLPAFLVVNILPPVVSVLALGSFYMLARELHKDLRIRLVALVAYASMPSAFIPQTEAGGLAESFGSLAMVWLIITLVRANRLQTTWAYSLVGLSWAVCIVASPGSAYASVLTAVLFFSIQLMRAWRSSWMVLVQYWSISAAIAVLASSPYWLTVMINHGFTVFTDSFGSQHSTFLDMISAILKRIFVYGVAGPGFGYITHIWGVLVLIGLIGYILRQQWIMPLWLILCFSIPRESEWLGAIPAALLAGYGIVFIFDSLFISMKQWYVRKFARKMVFMSAVVLVCVVILLNAQAGVQRRIIEQYKTDVKFDRYNGITYAALDAMEWVKNNTPLHAQFIALSRDQTLEWLPYVTQRTVVNVPFGSEWEPAEKQITLELKGQIKRCKEFICICESVIEYSYHNDIYLYIEKPYINDSENRLFCKNIELFILWKNNEVVIALLPDT